jgi:anthranilate synthase component 2
MVFVLDNYDSFTYNLVQYMGELGAEMVIRRNDELSPAEVEALKPDRILISPGPCTPQEAGISIGLLKHFAESQQNGGRRVPILGVCLGHQAIGAAFGGEVVRAKKLMHGKTSEVEHDGKTIFENIPNAMTCTRYHSLIVGSLGQDDRRGHWRDHRYGAAPSFVADRRRPVSPRKRADQPRAHHDRKFPENVGA